MAPGRLLMLAVVVVLPAAPARAQPAPGADPPPSAAAPMPLTRLTGPVVLDGRLDDAGWVGVDTLPLVTLEPVAGRPPTDATEIRVAYDDEHVWLAARLVSAHPDGPLINSYTRDRWGSDDIVELVLDTYDDNETAAIFTVNAAGNRLDAQVSNDAEFTYGFPVNYSWNAFWDVAVDRRADGWTVEMRIPFSSLRFEAVDGRVVMGMIVNTYNARLNESSTFPVIDPRWNFGVNKPSQARDVVFTGIEAARPLYVSPYVLGGVERNWAPAPDGVHPDATTDTREIGGDARYALTDNLNLDLTVNTDFAQVEADDQQVNLTRFSLFFPEKRQFFQERAGIFELRTGGDNRLFHSRRIGLVDGEPVRILGGGRLVGRVGGWDLGVLDMQTDDARGRAGENFGVARVRRRVVNDFSYVGGMLTTRLGGPSDNVAYGLDASVRLGGGRNLTVDWAQSFSEGDGGFASATGRVLLEDRDRRGLGYRLAVSRTGDAYDPGVGFVRRLDYREASASATWGIFADSASMLRRYGPRVEGSWLVRDSDGGLETAELSVGWELEAKSGGMFNGGVAVTREDLVEGFTLAGGAASVPAGRHDFVHGRAFLSTPQAAAVQASAFVRAGQFFDGTLVSVSVSPQWRASPHVLLAADLERSRVRFADRGDGFDASVLRLRTSVAPDTRLSVEAFVQYSSVAEGLFGNVRARYAFSEGRDLWLVFNEVRNTRRFRDDVFLPPVAARTLIVKYAHTFSPF